MTEHQHTILNDKASRALTRLISKLKDDMKPGAAFNDPNSDETAHDITIIRRCITEHYRLMESVSQIEAKVSFTFKSDPQSDSFIESILE